jgi:hypothetical protein
VAVKFQAFRVLLGGQGGCAEGDVEHRGQAVYRDGARQVQRPPDVLVVDHAVGECDAPAEPLGEPAGSQVPRNEVDDRRGLKVSVPLECDRVHGIDPQPSADEGANRGGGGQFVVADDVGGDLADPPPGAQGGGVPLLVGQILEQSEVYRCSSSTRLSAKKLATIRRRPCEPCVSAVRLGSEADSRSDSSRVSKRSGAPGERVLITELSGAPVRRHGCPARCMWVICGL